MSTNHTSQTDETPNSLSPVMARGGRVIVVDGQASRGADSLIESSHEADPGGPPRHVRHGHEEAFYVLEGSLRLNIDGEILTLQRGEWAVVSRGKVHQPSNRSDGLTRFLIISSPPLDEFFVAIARHLSETGQRPTHGALEELAERYDSAFVNLPAVDRPRLNNKRAAPRRSRSRSTPSA